MSRFSDARSVGAMLALLLAASSVVHARPAVDGRRLTVGDGGVLLHDGVPFRAIGVNYVPEFDGTAARRPQFAALAAHGIPFARFIATGFYPSQLAEYEERREVYLGVLDEIVAAAEESGIGLIPSLFWHTSAVPDLVDEPRNQWGNPDSETIGFMRQYTRDIVSRYRYSPAIWAWEFGNEYSLAVDLPNAAEYRPRILPTLGTPSVRGPDDDLTTDMVAAAFEEFAKVVRSLDSTRPITPGNAAPRPHAESMRLGGGWGELDTRAEFMSNIALVTPSPHDMVSVHVYEDEVRFAPDHRASVAEVVGLAAEASRRQGKALFVGEFGVDDFAEGGPEHAAVRFAEMLQAQVEHDVALAAVWVYDYDVTDQPNRSGWNITTSNSRKYMLEAIQHANERISSTAHEQPVAP